MKKIVIIIVGATLLIVVSFGLLLASDIITNKKGCETSGGNFKLSGIKSQCDCPDDLGYDYTLYTCRNGGE